jgi:hypothetical protein
MDSVETESSPDRLTLRTRCVGGDDATVSALFQGLYEMWGRGTLDLSH